MEEVYLLWDGTDDWGSNPKVRLHSVHATRESAEEEKRKQHMEGAFFYIHRELVKS